MQRKKVLKIILFMIQNILCVILEYKYYVIKAYLKASQSSDINFMEYLWLFRLENMKFLLKKFKKCFHGKIEQDSIVHNI